MLLNFERLKRGDRLCVLLHKDGIATIQVVRFYGPVPGTDGAPTQLFMYDPHCEAGYPRLESVRVARRGAIHWAATQKLYAEATPPGPAGGAAPREQSWNEQLAALDREIKELRAQREQALARDEAKDAEIGNLRRLLTIKLTQNDEQGQTITRLRGELDALTARVQGHERAMRTACDVLRPGGILETVGFQELQQRQQAAFSQQLLYRCKQPGCPGGPVWHEPGSCNQPGAAPRGL